MNHDSIDTTLSIIAVLLAATGPVVPSLFSWLRSKYGKTHSKRRTVYPTKRLPSPPRRSHMLARVGDVYASSFNLALLLVILGTANILSAIAFSYSQTTIDWQRSVASGHLIACVHVATFTAGLMIAVLVSKRKITITTRGAFITLILADIVALGSSLLSIQGIIVWQFAAVRIAIGTAVLVAFTVWMGRVLQTGAENNRLVSKSVITVGFLSSLTLLLAGQLTNATMVALMVIMGLLMASERIATIWAAAFTLIAIAGSRVHGGFVFRRLVDFFQNGASTGWEHVVVVRSLLEAVPFGVGHSIYNTFIPRPYSTDALAIVAVTLGVIPAFLAFTEVVYIGIRLFRSGNLMMKTFGSLIGLLLSVNLGAWIGATPTVYATLPMISFDVVMTFSLPIILALLVTTEKPVA